MNRHDRRVNDSAVRRTGTVSVQLLQQQLQGAIAENAQLRNVLYAICKEQGRVRFAKATIDSLREGDCLESRDLGPEIMIEFKPSNMVVPGGMKDGKANEPKESA